MRKSRFSGVESATAAPLPLRRLLAFDFHPPDHEEAPVIAERARMLAVSLPLLTAAHLLWCALLALAYAAEGQHVPFAPAWLAVGLLGLDLGLRRLLRRPDAQPHQSIRLATAHAALCGVLWLLAAFALCRSGSPPIAAQFALVAGAGATLPAFFFIPVLAILACVTAFGIGAELKVPPALLGAGGLFGLLLSFLSLQRARDYILRAGRHLLLEADAEKARRFIDDFEASGRGWFWETNAEGLLTYASDELARHLGVDASALIGRRFDDILLVEKAQEEGGHALGFHLGARFPFADLVVRAPGGETCWLLSGTPNFDSYGRFLGFRGLGSNLTEQRRSEAEQNKLARTDSLTGLPNRAAMRAMLEAALANAAERRRGCALMLIDLDRFKQVNDTLGHPVGDKLLKQVAERLKKAIGQEGQVGRLGGDEFEAVLPAMAEEGRLGDLAEALIADVSRPYAIDGHQVMIGASVGLAVARPGKTWADGLIKEADLALYAAKHDGRGVHRFFREEMHEGAAERQVLEGDLRNALARDQLRLLYQPIVDAVSEEPVAFEALLRWHHPTRGIVPAIETVALAEEAGLMGRIGDWVIRTACAEAAKWPRHVRIAVNLSPAQLAEPALPAIVTGALAAARLDPERLELEVGENVFTSDGKSAERLGALRELGVRLALDNFGTGRCSLGHLRDAPLDKIKIDRSFVRGAAEPGSRNAAIVRAIVVLAESLGIDTTAEGAETLEELALIRRLGCSQVQGFIFSKPVPPEQAQALAADSRPSAEVVGFGRPPRHRLIRTGQLRIGEEALPVRLRNISEGGAMIECDRPLEAGERVALDLNAAGLLDAEIRWCQRGQVGLRFDQPFQLGKLARSSRKPGARKMLRPDYLAPDAMAAAAAPPAVTSPLRTKRSRQAS
ncbi:MAG TPA: EAL domain-containing protein [Allosphingosinicella sp.]|jgi:diguanylate cyclase (GGDEF)-like protein|nr:EAL domain-containing protein [Allosphingosinicella sp.]